MLNTIYFDLGNVLFFFDHQKMIDQIAACCNLPSPYVKQLAFEQSLQENHEKGLLSSEALFRHFKSLSSASFSFRDFLEALSDIFVPNTALWPLVEDLKQKAHRLIIISNTCESHYNRVYSCYPILRLFDDKILSFEVGCLKPDPRIFHKALTLSQCPTENCFYTDDIPAYVKGARAAGLDSEIYTDVASLRQHLIHRGLNPQ